MWNLYWGFYKLSAAVPISVASVSQPNAILEVDCHRCKLQANSSEKSNAWRRRDEVFDLPGQISWTGLSPMQAEANFDSLKKSKAWWQRDDLTGQIPWSGLSPVGGMYIKES